MATRDEILRFLIETTGAKDLDGLRAALERVAAEAEQGEPAAKALIDELDQLARQSAAADRLYETGAALVKLQDDLKGARAGLATLAQEFDENDRSSKGVNKAFKDAEATVAKLEKRYAAQVEAAKRAGAAAKELGVNVRQVDTEQQRLRAAVEAASTSVGEQAAKFRAADAAQAALQARLAAGDEAFRRQTAANRASTAALDAYKAKAAQAAAAEDQLGNARVRGIGVIERLKGALIGLTAYIGLRQAYDGINGLLGIGDAAEGARIRLEALYGTRSAADQAFGQLRQLSRDLGVEFDGVLEAAAKLKSFGLEPLDGTLEALINQNAKLGGSQEQLQGIILAVGQAWAKQKLQGEEILQLIERNVPVWDLLSRATGKNTLELQKLSEQGKLGRDVIAALLAEIGKAADGAAEKNLGRLSSLFVQLKDRVQQVSNSGVLDYFKGRVSALIAEIDRLAKSGQLAQFARQFSDAIVRTAQAVESAIRFVVQYSGALVELAKAYAAIRFAAFVAGLAQSTAKMYEAAVAAKETAARIGGLRGAIAAVPASLRITVAAIGLELLVSSLIDLKAQLDELRDEERLATDARDRAARAQQKLNDAIRIAIEQNATYRGTVKLTAEQIASWSAAELESYRQREEAAARYYSGLATQARQLGDAVAEKAANEQLQAYLRNIDAIKQRLEQLRVAKEKGFASPESQGLTEALRQLGVNAQLAGERITDAGGKAVAAFAQVATASDASAAQVGGAFAKALQAVQTTAEVDRLQQSLRVAFEAGKISAEQYAIGAKAAAERTKEITDAANEAAGGFARVKKASDEATAAIIAGWKATRVALAGQADAIARQLADAIKAGADEGSAEFRRLVDASAEVDAKILELTSNINAAEQAQSRLGDSSGYAGQQLTEVGASAEIAASGAGQVSAAAAEAAISLGEMSQAALDLYRQINNSVGTGTSWDAYLKQINSVTQAVTEQRKAADARLQQLQDEIALYDPLTQKVELLRAQYGLVDDSRLEQIAQAELRVEQERQRVEREQDALRREQDRNAGAPRPPTRPTDPPDTPRPGGGGGGVNVVINIEGPAFLTDARSIDMLARALKPALDRLDRLKG